jgi:uncharacterized protein
MIIEEMTDRDCRAMLARTGLARLACALHNQPYIVPIHVDFYDVYLYGFATLGQKIEWMRQNPHVCLEFDDITDRTHWASVVVSGDYEELPDTSEFADARRTAEQLFQRHPVWWEPASVPLADHQPRGRILFRILINRMTGRRGVTGETTELDRVTSVPRSRRSGNVFRLLRRALGKQTADR